MGFFGGLVRGLGDIATFGTNELAGNPIGKFYDQVTNPSDPNAAANAYNAQQADLVQKNIAMEYDFAKNGISWRIADAAKNGISPLAALGASEPSFSPVTQAFAPTVSQPSLGHDLLSAGAGELGQGLARSLITQRSPEQKASDALDLAYKSKENDLLDVQVANAKLELARHAMNPGVPGGRSSASRTVMNEDGTTSLVPNYNTREEPFGGVLWMMNNKLIPGVKSLYTNLWEHQGPITYYRGGR